MQHIYTVGDNIHYVKRTHGRIDIDIEGTIIDLVTYNDRPMYKVLARIGRRGEMEVLLPAINEYITLLDTVE